MGLLSNLKIAADTGQYAIKQLVTQPVAFTQQLKKYAWADIKILLTKGFTAEEAAEIERKLEICYLCEELLNKDTEYIRCRTCGCSLTWKSKLKNMRCELGKWDK